MTPSAAPGDAASAAGDAASDPTAPVRAELTARRDAARAARAALDAREGPLATARLLLFLAAVALAVLSAREALPWAVALLPAVAFCALVLRHRRLRRDREREVRREALHDAGLARLEGRWRGAGDGGDRYATAGHPYGDPLDVFGRGSLFEYVDRARSSAGKDTLAAWLGVAADGDLIRRRQRGVEELRPRADLREDLALLGTDAAAHADLGALPAWAEAPAVPAAGLRAGAVALPLLNAAGLAWWLAGDPSILVPAIPLVATGLFLTRTRVVVDGILRGADASLEDLRLLETLLARWERESFAAPLLAEARAALGGGPDGATRRIAALRRLLEIRDAAANQVFAPVAFALAWPVQMALAAEAWRRRTGPAVRGWLEALGQLEALCSLAGHAAEHPADCFPEIADAGPLLEGEGLGHPLLREAETARNDLTLDARQRVFVVSGSNMSGKSTFLRTVGVNVVLALAGGTVRARRLRLAPVALGASVNVHDSLLDGRSRFYAEAERVALVVRLAREGGPPLLFLLDELFHGTNSGDRREGAAAVVRTLLQRGAVGLLTTHDLELARLAEDLDGTVVNVHFEDRFEDGRMTFDYHLRPGVVTRSNALALMRAVGLDV